MRDASGAPAPHLWLCGHFCAKAFAVMLRELERDPSQRAMLWQTKSAVAPRGPEDGWARFLEMPAKVRRWGDRAESQSSLRKGSVDTASGTAAYLHLMSKV